MQAFGIGQHATDPVVARRW